MSRLRVALPTCGRKGLRDTVSGVFSRAETFTIVDVVGGEPRTVEVEENKASGLSQGAGPIAVRSLKDKGVEAVLSGDLGPGASVLLETVGIKAIRVETGIRVSEALKHVALGKSD